MHPGGKGGGGRGEIHVGWGINALLHENAFHGAMHWHAAQPSDMHAQQPLNHLIVIYTVWIKPVGNSYQRTGFWCCKPMLELRAEGVQ